MAAESGGRESADLTAGPASVAEIRRAELDHTGPEVVSWRRSVNDTVVVPGRMRQDGDEGIDAWTRWARQLTPMNRSLEA